jgi:hypothetical protein
MEGTITGFEPFARAFDRLPPNFGCAMKKYDWSDRKLKIAVLLAIAIIGWLCLKGASAAHGQTRPANLSRGARESVNYNMSSGSRS